MRKIHVLTVATLVAAVGLAAPEKASGIRGTITTENDTKTGLVSWSARAKAYVIKTGKLEAEIKASDVVSISIVKPAAFDAAVRNVESGNGAAAIAPLSAIVKNYAHLEWDLKAGSYLARAYLSANNADKALETCKAIISGDASAAYKGDLAPSYWQALLALNQTAKLESVLGKAASSGDRYSSACALLMRGDMILKAEGETGDAARKALADGYLRVALLYTEPSVAPRVRPEALFKAARCFEKINQASRADAFRTELKKAYAGDPWAAK